MLMNTLSSRGYGKVAALKKYIDQLEEELREFQEARLYELPIDDLHSLYMNNPRVRLVVTQEIQRNRGVGKIPMPVFSRGQNNAEFLIEDKEDGLEDEDEEPERQIPPWLDDLMNKGMVSREEWDKLMKAQTDKILGIGRSEVVIEDEPIKKPYLNRTTLSLKQIKEKKEREREQKSNG